MRKRIFGPLKNHWKAIPRPYTRPHSHVSHIYATENWLNDGLKETVIQNFKTLKLYYHDGKELLTLSFYYNEEPHFWEYQYCSHHITPFEGTMRAELDINQATRHNEFYSIMM